jgi:cyclopropane fatty-acyl-phospholipid synthase-like methyltransferase
MSDQIRPKSTTYRRALAIGSAITIGASVAIGGCTTFKRWAYEDFGSRDEWQQADRVVAELSLAPGQRVADLGSGGGYFTFRLAEAVGTSGHVYAVDVDQGMLDYLAGEAEERGLASVSVVLAALDDPKIPEPVDLVFVSNTYHHIRERGRYFERIRRSYLRADGRVAIVEYLGEKKHATPYETIEREMGQAGFQLVVDNAWLDRQSFLIFAPK